MVTLEIVNPVNAAIILQVVQYLTDPSSGSYMNCMLCCCYMHCLMVTWEIVNDMNLVNTNDMNLVNTAIILQVVQYT